ncbi:uncharacterized protein LOC125859236 [Solanum stenotomum]|uniref:uncharacterized protein LOC125859236 n=1 Tax=Solanum stenotomum TaxID=172797 RepID=UPI0020D1D0EE|nr:uncharacterized protein LOC125859236 [Solanum stenotomum]
MNGIEVTDVIEKVLHKFKYLDFNIVKIPINEGKSVSQLDYARSIMLPRRVVRVGPAMKSVEEQELPNALEVKTQEEIKYADFREAIRMFSQVATYHVGQGDNRHEVVDTSRIRELLRMNPPSFTSSSVTENPENFTEELKRVFDVMQSSKEGKAAMLIRDIDLERFMIHLQQVEEDKLKDREEFKDKRAKIVGDEFRQQKNDANQSSLPQKQKGPAPLFASALAPENKDGYNRNSYSFRARLAYPQGSMCGQSGHFMQECPKNSQSSGNLGNRAQASSVASPDRMVPRGAISSTGGGANRLYAINSRQG